MPGTRVTCTDIETGETETVVIEDDCVLVCDGDKYLPSIDASPDEAGTIVITVKTRKDKTR